jgi:hypothetical protein
VRDPDHRLERLTVQFEPLNEALDAESIVDKIVAGYDRWRQAIVNGTK